MIDTHTHLYFPEFNDDIGAIMQNCRQKGVSHFILPNVDKESIGLMKCLHDAYPETTSMAMGLHPTEVNDDWETVMETIKSEIHSGDFVAVGEVGMDLYWDKSYEKQQKQAFYQQLKLADQYNLPVIIHSRSAFPETIEIIRQAQPSVPLIFHSFTGDKKIVNNIREVCDPYFGINGVVTFKNAADLRESLHEIGIDKILLETDSPYLTPAPHRGKRNDSSFLEYIRDVIGQTLGLPSEDVEKITDNNAKSVFRL